MYGRIIYISLLALLINMVGCKSLRISESESKGIATYNSGEFHKKIRENNIADGPVVINKISIRLDNGERNRRFRANLKYDGKDSVLVSIRTLAGIEAARILIDKDSIRINDRINKIYYSELNKILGERLGLSPDRISLILGDYDQERIRNRRLKCEEGIYRNVIERPPGFYEYIISCKEKKIIELNVVEDNGRMIAKGEFNEFEEIGGKKYPGHVKWHFIENNTLLDITLENIRLNGNTRMIFRRYPEYEKQVIR